MKKVLNRLIRDTNELEEKLSGDVKDIKATLEGIEDRIYKRVGMIAGVIGFIFFLFDRLRAK